MFQPILLHGRKLIHNLRVHPAFRGFTLIESMIVLAVIAIIVTLAIPAYSNYSIRVKITESLSIAASAKTSVAATCQEDLTIANLNNELAGYKFEETKYVLNIVLGGPCLQPTITMTTQATGAQPDPVLIITGYFTAGKGSISWTCESSSPNFLVPETCRS